MGKHTGTIQINITANTTETATAVLNASGAGSASYSSILIKPTGGGLKTISGSLAAPLIDLNGADNITIDGLYPSNDSLLIVNASTSTTAGTSTIRFINGASNNFIQNCGVFGASAATTSGTIFFSTDAGSTNGNDNNVISQVLLGNASASATPRYGVYGSGTTGKENNSNTIKGCWIFNFYCSTTSDRAGIYLGTACTDFTIYGNSFFQESSRSISSATYSAIYINNTSGSNFIIRKNKIGGSQADCAGSATSLNTSPNLHAIYLNVSTSGKTIVDSNEISNITMSTTNTSIIQSLLHINNGKVDVVANTFGSQSVAASISIPSTPTSTTFSVIGMGSGTFDTINVHHNTMGGLSLSGSGGMSLRGLDITGSTATMLINNNIFGSPTVANSWSQTTDNSILAIIMRANYAGATHQIMNNTFCNMFSSTGTMRAIYTGGATSSWNISGNILFNLSTTRTAAGTGVNAANIAIIVGGGGFNQTISNNKIYGIKVTGAGAMTATGIYVTGTPTGNCIISNNLIHSINVATATGSIIGIDIGSGNFNYFNNIIRLGYDETGANISTSLSVIGINETGGVNNIYDNSIYIGGSNISSGSDNTYALNSSLSNSTRFIKNNIFDNERSNCTGIGKHYSIKLGGFTGLSINANNYYNGSSFLAQNNTTDINSLGLWIAATSQDSISVSSNSKFKNPIGSTSTLDLHIDTAGTAVNNLESSGVVISGFNNDYDGDARPGPSGSVKGGGTRPDIGADEFDGVPRPQCSNSVAGTVVASDTICYNNDVSLSLTGTSGVGVGSTFQWQSSANNVTFSNISGANQNTFTDKFVTNTTYYRCLLTCYFGSTTSTSSVKKVTVINPQITTTTPGSICGTGVVTLGATASLGVVTWYANATGGTAIDTGVVFITPSISATTTYYVSAIFNGCTSTSRTPVVATIKSIPSLTSVTPNTLCGPGSMTLSATTGLGTIDWYTSSTGGTSVGTGLYFTTPSLTVTTTYYVEVTASGCVSTSRTPVVATIIPLPTIASVTPAGTCNSGSVVLHATANAGTVYWYSASGGGSPLDTGTIFTTPVIFAPTTYYVEAHENVCVSASRTPVVASIYSNPNITGTTAASGCTGDKVTLGASASAGVINWYTSATGGTSIATGTSFTTPALTTTTTYYVDATANGCTSNFRTPAKATINPIPTITGVTPASSCGNASLTLLATASNGIISWYDVATGGTAIITGGTYTTPVLSTTTTYYVETKDNGCISTRTPVKATIRAIPTINSSNSVATCRPSSLNLSATTNNGIVRWYSVPFGGVVLATGNSFTTPVITTSTTYYVDAFDSGCVSTTRTGINATIFPSINKATTVNGFTITATANGINYQWVDCNNNYQIISGATSQSYTPTVNGNYAVILKNTNCTDTSACVPITKIGIDNILMNQKISVAPNPTKDLITIKVTSDLIGLKYNLTDIMGRVMMTGEIHNEQQQINLQNLRPGIYLLNVGDTQLQNFRIVKE